MFAVHQWEGVIKGGIVREGHLLRVIVENLKSKFNSDHDNKWPRHCQQERFGYYLD